MLMTTKKEVLIISIIAVALFAGGYGTGRFAAPDKVVTTEKVVTVTQDHLVTTVDTAKILDAIKNVNVQKDVHTIRIIEHQKDGTVKETVTTDDKSKSESQIKTEDKEKAQSVRVEEHIVYKDREVTKTVERNRPQWALGLTPGFDFAGALGHGSAISLLPSTATIPHLVLGADLTRRVIGPLSAGIWVNSAGMGGAVLRLEF